MSQQEERTLMLIRSAKRGDEQAFNKILKELEPDLRKLAARYYIMGSDAQDVLQECRIGVWKAVQDYDETEGMSFRNFAINTCCYRHMITCIAHANRKKYDIFNRAVSLDAPMVMGDDEIQTIGDFIEDRLNPFQPSPSRDLVEEIIIRDEYEEMAVKLDEVMTDMERRICSEYSVEESYKGIAAKLGVKAKAVDNGMVRIRKKATDVYQRHLQEQEGGEGLEAPAPKRRRKGAKPKENL